MNPLDMISLIARLDRNSKLMIVSRNFTYHVVKATKYSLTPVPLAINGWVVLGLVPSKIFLVGKSASAGLRAVRMSAEE